VAVRVRQPLPRELDEQINWAWSNEKRQIWYKHSDSASRKTFAYDRLYTPESNNAEVHQGLVSPIIDSVLQGFNATIFAYGQTASGNHVLF
jgi:hypothetical protein